MTLMKLNNCGYLPLWEGLNARFVQLAKEQPSMKYYSIAWAAKSIERTDRVGHEIKQVILQKAQEDMEQRKSIQFKRKEFQDAIQTANDMLSFNNEALSADILRTLD